VPLESANPGAVADLVAAVCTDAPALLPAALALITTDDQMIASVSHFPVSERDLTEIESLDDVGAALVAAHRRRQHVAAVEAAGLL